MELFTDLAAWLTEPGRWSLTDSGGVPFRTVQHLWVTLVSLLLAMVIAVPPALVLAHRRKAEALASSIVNIGRAVPSFGLIVVFWLVAVRTPWLGIQFWPLVAALVAFALPPLFTNTYTAIREVDAATVEAARGMGYTERHILTEIELPLALPVIFSAVRLVAVQVLATAAIGAIVTDGGGLGRFIVDGLAAGPGARHVVLGGALLLGALTLLVEATLGLVERRLMPRGVKQTVARSMAAPPGPARARV
jgi:osmoprotectant transport system permease protein